MSETDAISELFPSLYCVGPRPDPVPHTSLPLDTLLLDRAYPVAYSHHEVHRGEIPSVM